jgi:hypothetical protein
MLYCEREARKESVYMHDRRISQIAPQSVGKDLKNRVRSCARLTSPFSFCTSLTIPFPIFYLELPPRKALHMNKFRDVGRFVVAILRLIGQLPHMNLYKKKASSQSCHSRRFAIEEILRKSVSILANERDIKKTT